MRTMILCDSTLALFLFHIASPAPEQLDAPIFASISQILHIRYTLIFSLNY